MSLLKFFFSDALHSSPFDTWECRVITWWSLAAGHRKSGIWKDYHFVMYPQIPCSVCVY